MHAWGKALRHQQEEKHKSRRAIEGAALAGSNFDYMYVEYKLIRLCVQNSRRAA
jgi:hypothetical protein